MCDDLCADMCVVINKRMYMLPDYPLSKTIGELSADILRHIHKDGDRKSTLELVYRGATFCSHDTPLKDIITETDPLIHAVEKPTEPQPGTVIFFPGSLFNPRTLFGGPHIVHTVLNNVGTPNQTPPTPQTPSAQ